MKRLIFVAIAALAFSNAFAAMGFLVSQRNLGGTTWLCEYNVNGTTLSVTINSLCPQAWNF
jgi:hypothetical protein